MKTCLLYAIISTWGIKNSIHLISWLSLFYTDRDQMWKFDQKIKLPLKSDFGNVKVKAKYQIWLKETNFQNPKLTVNNIFLVTFKNQIY